MAASEKLKKKLLILNNPCASLDAIETAGEALLLAIYNVSNIGNLNTARFLLHQKTIAKQPIHAQFRLGALPPTTAAARQHSLRAYHQVQQWLNVVRDPLQFGWKREGGNLLQRTSNLPAAPPELLHITSCSCKDECNKNCECRKSGLKCSTLCSYCSGHACMNKDAEDEINDEEEILEEDHYDFEE